MKRVNVIGSSGTPKRRILESIDRISLLPDSILGIILSFLPTKNAVSTSVLSKRWKLVWTMVHNLDLCNEDSSGEEQDDMRFVGFVDRVLLHHDAGCLNKFRLVWTPKCVSSHAAIAASWINTAISKNVHELFLCLETHTLVNHDDENRTSPIPFVMPNSVFRCDTLRILGLDGGISVSESIAVCLPKLETLILESIHFQSEVAFDKLIRGCRKLINLHITIIEDPSYADDDFTYIISSTSLRHLEIDILYPNNVPLYTYLELEAPSLEYLSLYGFIPVFLGKTCLKSLVEAKLNVDLGHRDFSDVDMCNSVVEAVRVFECAEALKLSVSIIWALSCATNWLGTEFKRLVKLEAGTYSCGCTSLLDFIECSVNLEVLSVVQYESCGEILCKNEWMTPTQVPRCLSNSLKTVKITGYYGVGDEWQMVHYILENGKALEDMEITFDNDWSVYNNAKGEFIQDVCEFSKKLSSKVPVCEVKFAGKTSKCNIKVL